MSRKRRFKDSEGEPTAAEVPAIEVNPPAAAEVLESPAIPTAIAAAEDKAPPVIDKPKPAAKAADARPSCVPADAIGWRDYGDRVVYVDRNGQKKTVAR